MGKGLLRAVTGGCLQPWKHAAWLQSAEGREIGCSDVSPMMRIGEMRQSRGDGYNNLPYERL